MKKVARLRIPQEDHLSSSVSSSNEHVGVRTTGRIKKPKAVFDPSDNYLPRAQRLIATLNAQPVTTSAANISTGSSTSSDRNKDTPSVASTHSAQDNKRLSQSSSASTSSFADTNDVCIVCFKREAKRGTNAKNKLITCLECGKKIHKLCLKADFEDIDTLRQNYKCENCRCCDVCDAFSDDDSKANVDLVTCTKCVKSYHLTCHIPNVLKFQQFQRSWKCNKCTLPTIGNGNTLPVKTIREIIGDDPHKSKYQPHQYEHGQSKPALSQNINIAAAAAEAKTAAAVAAAVKRTHQEHKDDVAAIPIINGSIQVANEPKRQRPSEDEATTDLVTAAAATVAANLKNATAHITRYSPNEPIDLPDVKYWNVEQVTDFFAKYFPNEAHVFKEHEIDGMSLLLLKRSDVIKKLPIKLGPSLRIYSLILKIQTQLNDPTLGWNCGL